MGFWDTLKQAGKEMYNDHLENTKEMQKRVDKEKVMMEHYNDSKLLEIKNSPRGKYTEEQKYAAAQILRAREY